ncbi:hypothetical protein ACFP1I_15070 [Dyadobacter subterraneus]|uniref:DoxX family membrane protein n=1 Tax=Dyadobacter subterraneus TaxID=2773304 RepID=A0ABR9WBR1_9BACT|nr:hypothetical protein [Dyadobacter subterraneus]MBE9462913.1 hypothetical protein [Dyadobacter subterraneus]
MFVLLVLIISFGVSCGFFELISGNPNLLFSGNIAMCIMLLFTAIGHFKFPDGMAKMIPSFIPYKKELVFITGILEVLAGFALLFPQTRYFAGLFLLLFFICILPANIYAAAHHLDYQKGTYDGNGLKYLWFRVPMQIFLIAWVWFFAIENSTYTF